jgi:hypothetical protein
MFNTYKSRDKRREWKMYTLFFLNKIAGAVKLPVQRAGASSTVKWRMMGDSLVIT